MKARLNLLWILPLVMVVAAGCSKKVDTNKPIEQIRAEAEKMSVGDLEKTAQAYVQEITNKKSDMTEIQKKLKTLKPTELLGEKAKGIKEEVSAITTQVKALTERYNIYADQFKKAGGDLSKIKLG